MLPSSFLTTSEKTMTQPLEQIIHLSQKPTTHAIIWLHGLGADADDFAPLLPHLDLKPTTRVIFPNANVMPITINRGMRMRAWYDISDIEMKNVDTVGIERSAAQIELIYNAQRADNIAAERIIFAGFSQGGVMSLHLGLKNPCRGILALSCYLAEENNIPAPTPSSPKILHIHGTEDSIVMPQAGYRAHQILSAAGYDSEYTSYPMGHEVCAAEIEKIKQWFHQLGF